MIQKNIVENPTGQAKTGKPYRPCFTVFLFCRWWRKVFSDPSPEIEPLILPEDLDDVFRNDA